MRRVLIDTDTLSYVLKGADPQLVATMRQYIRVFRRLTTSVVTIAEIVEGLEQMDDAGRTQAFLQAAEEYEVLPIGFEEAILAGRILGALAPEGKKIGDLDPFIAAVAITHGLPLVTNNRRHYERIVALGFSLELESWR